MKYRLSTLSLFMCLLFVSCFTTQKTTEINPPATPDVPSVAEAKTPKNVIFMVGDGMGISQITAGMYMNNNKLALERCSHIGLIKTHSSDNLVTDSAAGATAFACGQKTYNGAIGVNDAKEPIKTILEYAEEKGLETGLVATSTIVHATPASFAAHQPSRKMYDEIAFDMLDADVEVMIGGGKMYFEAATRADKQDLIKVLKEKNYTVADDVKDVTADADKIMVFTAADDPKKKMEGRDYLMPASQLAIERLSKSEQGFFLMIEGSQIDWGGHANDSEYIITEMLDFDETVAKVLDFVEKDGETLLVITADHETGGYAINPESVMNDTIVAGFTTGYHTAAMIPVFAHGVGAENFSGIYENTAIYDKMMEALRLKK